MVKEKILIAAIVLGFVIGLSSFIEGGVNCYNSLNKRGIKLGILAQMKIVENQNKISRLKNEIDNIEKENRQILVDVLKANGVMPEDYQQATLDTKNWILSFRKGNE